MCLYLMLKITFSASFSSGAYLEVKEMNGFIAVFIVNLPKQYKGLTRGLMGNYNGDISDDLIPKGSNESLPLNSSLQTIHEQFGLTCEKYIVLSMSQYSLIPLWKKKQTRFVAMMNFVSLI